MALGILVLMKLISLFTLVILGFVASRYIGIDKESIAKLLFYVLAPIIFFTAIAKLEPNFSIFFLPIIITFVSGTLASLVFTFAKRFDSPEKSAILAFSSVNANVGYFILPVIWELFSERAVGIFIVMMLGNSIYESTIGYYIASRGQLSPQESLQKLLKLPSIYAMLLGIIFSITPFLSIPVIFDDMISNMRGAYTTLGMMIIGFGLADIKSFKLDLKFISYCFTIKFVLLPIFILFLISLDKIFFNIYDSSIYKMLILFSIAPMAANNIVISGLLNLYPEKISAAVVASTIFAIFYIPLIIGVFGISSTN